MKFKFIWLLLALLAVAYALVVLAFHEDNFSLMRAVKVYNRTPFNIEAWVENDAEHVRIAPGKEAIVGPGAKLKEAYEVTAIRSDTHQQLFRQSITGTKLKESDAGGFINVTIK